MRLEQSFEVAAPIDRVWSTLIDIERVAPCLPGAAVTGRNDDGTYNGTFRVKIGPTSASYSGKLEMDDLQEDDHTATMHASGTDKRGQGGAKATIKSKLTAVGDAATRVDVDTDYHITGRLARFGRGGMIEDITERLLGDFVKCLQTSMAAAPDLSGISSGPSGVAADGGADTGDGDGAAEGAAAIEPGAAQAAGGVEAEAGAFEAEAGAAEAEEAGAAEAEEAGAAEAEEGTEEARVAASAQVGANGGATPVSGSEDLAPPAPAGAGALGAGGSTGAAGTGGPPESGVSDAPVQSPEPLDGLSLVGSVLWDRAKGNPARFAFVVGLLVALRRARRSN